MSIHAAIKALRIGKDWSHERLAEEVSAIEKLSKPLTWQTVQQWENGKSAPLRKRLPHVAKALGVSFEQLQALAADQELLTPLAHQLGDGGPTLSSPFIKWGDLKMRAKKLPRAFKVATPDDSMVPLLKPGQVVEFETGLDLRAGDGILVIDEDGEPCIRRCRRAHGEWEAFAEDEKKHLPFRIGPDQLLAVLVGVHARWG